MKPCKQYNLDNQTFDFANFVEFKQEAIIMFLSFRIFIYYSCFQEFNAIYVIKKKAKALKCSDDKCDLVTHAPYN